MNFLPQHHTHSRMFLNLGTVQATARVKLSGPDVVVAE